MEALGWSQFGLAGLVVMSLGSVIAYIFKLFLRVQTQATERALHERDDEQNENIRLHNRLEDQQRATLTTLADVARVMSEVQQMLREREVQAAMEKEFQRRKQDG